MARIVPQNIIVRMPNWLGDFIMATPVLADLKEAFPKSRISVLAKGDLGDLIEADRIITLEQKGLADCLRGEKFDLGILLPNSFSSAWLFWRAKVPAIGFKGDVRRGLLKYPVAFPPNRRKQHLVKTYKALLEPLGIGISDTRPKVSVKRGAYIKKEGKIVVGVNPGAAYGAAKCWPVERFREVVRKLCEDSRVKVVIVGNQEKMVFDSRAVNLIGRTDLGELASVIADCDVFLTNDSGPMHLAEALGVPPVAIFGSTSPEVTGPYLRGEVVRKKTACSPCFKRSCLRDFSCMLDIKTDEIIKKLYGYIERIYQKNQSQSP